MWRADASLAPLLLSGASQESELVYEEWVQVIARVCDAKVPDQNRDGKEFEWVLQRWLHYAFVAMYKTLLEDKARGLASKTL